MKNILLVCNQGMSTSFLVEKMKQATKRAKHRGKYLGGFRCRIT